MLVRGQPRRQGPCRRFQPTLEVLLLLLVCSPFEGSGNLKLPRGRELNQEISATTVVTMDTGPETAKKTSRTMDSTLPEALLVKGPHTDTLQVQNFDICKTFFEYETGVSDINVKGRLKQSFDFWENIGTSSFILDVIKYGYKIPLLSQPESIFLNNNKSALDHKEFVSKAILDLVKNGLVKNVLFKPHVINPLSVSVNSSVKERLSLDLRHVNKHVVVNKIKFEDWRTVKQYINLNCYGYKFDLKSGYHHLDIFDTFQKYLGFSWVFDNKVNYFMFTVLPFGLSASGYIFTKVVRQLVKHWRNNGIKMAVYLDDGFGVSNDLEVCRQQAFAVKADLVASGFVPNKDKCVWQPSQSVE